MTYLVQFTAGAARQMKTLPRIKEPCGGRGGLADPRE